MIARMPSSIHFLLSIMARFDYYLLADLILSEFLGTRTLGTLVITECEVNVHFVLFHSWLTVCL